MSEHSVTEAKTSDELIEEVRNLLMAREAKKIRASIVEFNHDVLANRRPS